MTGQQIGLLLFVIVVGGFFIITIREFFLWYFKINERINQLKLLNANIKLLVEAAGKEPLDYKVEKKK